MDSRVPGKESKQAAERLSRLLVEGIPGVDDDIRYHFAKTGFQLTCRDMSESADPLFLSFARLRELNDDELRSVIRSHLQGEGA